MQRTRTPSGRGHSLWYRKNRERILAERREQRIANKHGVAAKRLGVDATTVPPAPEVCEVCSRQSKTALHLDHDHDTGAFRGWLCRKCNLALGLLADDPELLRKLAAYLEGKKC